MPLEQLASEVHVVGQPDAVQRNAPQVIEVAAAQPPVPLQNAAGVKVVPLQVEAAQLTLVAASVQAPLPLQVPVLPQVALTLHWPDGAGSPDVIAEQVPSPSRLQDRQVPQTSVMQQTPSVQNPEVHSSSTAQLFDSALRGLQVPFELAVQ